MFGLKRFRVHLKFNAVIRPGLETLFGHFDRIVVQQQFTTSLKHFIALCEVRWKERVDDPQGALSEIVKTLEGIEEVFVIASDRRNTLGFVKGMYNELYTELFMYTTREFLCFIEYPITILESHGVLNLIGQPGDVERLIEHMREWGTGIEIVSITNYHTRDRGVLSVLTDRQLSVVRRAHKMGFFDHPRRADARTIADALGMRHTTFLTHIRKAQKRMLDELLTGL